MNRTYRLVWNEETQSRVPAPEPADVVPGDARTLIGLVPCALALYMVMAWRIGFLMRMGRNCPDLDATLLFEHDEWRAVHILNGKKPPAAPPPDSTTLSVSSRDSGDSSAAKVTASRV